MRLAGVLEHAGGVLTTFDCALDLPDRAQLEAVGANGVAARGVAVALPRRVARAATATATSSASRSSPRTATAGSWRTSPQPCAGTRRRCWAGPTRSARRARSRRSTPPPMPVARPSASSGRRAASVAGVQLGELAAHAPDVRQALVVARDRLDPRAAAGVPAARDRRGVARGRARRRRAPRRPARRRPSRPGSRSARPESRAAVARHAAPRAPPPTSTSGAAGSRRPVCSCRTSSPVSSASSAPS